MSQSPWQSMLRSLRKPATSESGALVRATPATPSLRAFGRGLTRQAGRALRTTGHRLLTSPNVATPVETLRGALTAPASAQLSATALTRPADSTPPPELPAIQDVLAKAQASASKVGSITSSLATWREAVALYREVQAGERVTAMRLFKGARRISITGSNAASSAWRRSVMVAGLNSAAEVVAWKTAEKAKDDVLARILHQSAKAVAGRAGYVLMTADVLKSMHRDLKRYNDGSLSQEDLYRNLALTGVGVAAPLAGSAIGGPAGATAGLTVAIGASMLKR